MMVYIQLFFEFFKTGLFAIGGGLATIPFLSDLAERTGWFSQVDLLNMIAVSESTPGAIGVNMATYVGYEVRGVPGCVVATLGLVAPSIIVILIVARFLRRFSENRFVKAAMFGLRAASAALITAAGISVAEVTLVHTDRWSQGLAAFFGWKSILLFVVLLAATNLPKLKKIHPIAFIAVAGVVGVVFRFAGA